MRSPAGALWRWSDRHQSQLATIGLAAVLVLLAGFSLWAAMQTNAAARQVERDSAEQDVWQDARAELTRAKAASSMLIPTMSGLLSRSERVLRGIWRRQPTIRGSQWVAASSPTACSDGCSA